MLRESVRALLRSRAGRSAPPRPPGHHNWIHGLPLKMRFRRSKLYVSVIPIVALGAGIGFLGSVLGLGGGFIMVPALIYLLRVPTNVVIGTSLAYTLITMAVATVLHATANKTVDIMLALLLMVGGVIGAQFGAQVGQALRGEQLRALLALLVLLVALPRPPRPLPDAGGGLLAAHHGRRGVRRALRPLSRSFLPSRLTTAAAESLVSTLSDDSVEITSNFTGEQIVVFGAVRGAPEGDPGYQVAVVVQGPAQDIVVREKERVLGIWANRTSREFKDVPSYYVMHLSENFSAALTPADLMQYRLGVAEPALRPGCGAGRQRAALRRGADRPEDASAASTRSASARCTSWRPTSSARPSSCRATSRPANTGSASISSATRRSLPARPRR